MAKKLLIVSLIIYCLAFLTLLGLNIFSHLANTGFSTISYLYTLILIGWVFLTLHFHARSRISLTLAFMFFLLSAFLTIFNSFTLAEEFMRLSLIGWIVGLGIAVWESTSGR